MRKYFELEVDAELDADVLREKLPEYHWFTQEAAGHTHRRTKEWIVEGYNIIGFNVNGAPEPTILIDNDDELRGFLKGIEFAQKQESRT